MSTTVIPCISDIAIDCIVFGKYESLDGRTKVDVFKDSSSTAPKNKLNRFNLCRDASSPMETRYRMDSLREDGTNLEKRNLLIKVQDPIVASALHRLDERIIKEAMDKRKEWFPKEKKDISEEVIRSRYSPIIFRKDEADDFECVKVKVKLGGKVPSVLHLMEKDGRYRKNAGREEHVNKGSLVVPIVGAYTGIWFMGGGSSFGLSLQVEEMLVTPGEESSDTLDHFASSAPLSIVHERMEEGGGVELEEEGMAATKVELLDPDESAM